MCTYPFASLASFSLFPERALNALFLLFSLFHVLTVLQEQLVLSSVLLPDQ